MKIAISGAGIAGPTLAYWLARTGHEPLLIERAPAPRSGGYVIDFWGAGYEIAARMGLEAQIRAAGYRVRAVRSVRADGRSAAELDTAVFERVTDGRFTTLRRSDLAAILLGASGGAVETVYDEQIAAVEQDEGGVQLQLAQTGRRDVDLLVGADGLHSNTRRLVFGPERKFERFLGYGVAAFEAEGYRPRDELTYVMHSFPGHQVARFALRGDRTLFLLIFREDAHGLEARDRSEAASLLRRKFAGGGWECDRILEAMEGAPDLYLDRVSQIEMPTWAKGRIVLIGDAAACVSLLAGEGTGLAMAHAYVLAAELRAATGDVGQAAARYEQKLRPLMASKQKSARRFAGFFAPRTRLGIALRNLTMRAMNIGVVANALVGANLRDELELPAL